MTLEELIAAINEADELGINAPTTAAQAMLANVKLKKAELPEIPADFIQLLTRCNGLSHEDSAILGINTGSNFFPDLAEFNLQRQNRRQKSDALILGYDNSLYLIYNAASGTYQLIDQDSFDIEAESEEYYDFVPYLLTF